MRRKIFLIGLVLIVIFFISRPILGEEGVTVEVEGVAPVTNDNLINAKEMAVADALRKAVEQVVGLLVDSRSESKNYQIIQDTIKINSAGYVSKYEVLNGWKEQDYYKVLVRVTVKHDALKQSVDSLKLTLVRAGKPRLMILIPEPIVETQLSQGFISSGFPVVDQSKARQLLNTELGRQALNGDPESLSQLANQYQAEILIIGNVKPEPLGESYGMFACKAYLSIRAIKPDTGETLASQTFDERGIALSENEAYQKALPKVADLMLGYLKEQLGKKLVDNERSLQLTVRGISYSELQRIQGRLKGTPAVSNVFLRNFSSGSALFDIETSLLSNQLADIISEWTDLHLEILNISGNKLEIGKQLPK
jgi:hypothetical protein